MTSHGIAASSTAAWPDSSSATQSLATDMQAAPYLQIIESQCPPPLPEADQAKEATLLEKVAHLPARGDTRGLRQFVIDLKAYGQFVMNKPYVDGAEDKQIRSTLSSIAHVSSASRAQAAPGKIMKADLDAFVRHCQMDPETPQAKAPGLAEESEALPQARMSVADFPDSGTPAVGEPGIATRDTVISAGSRLLELSRSDITKPGFREKWIQATRKYSAELDACLSKPAALRFPPSEAADSLKTLSTHAAHIKQELRILNIAGSNLEPHVSPLVTKVELFTHWLSSTAPQPSLL